MSVQLQAPPLSPVSAVRCVVTSCLHEMQPVCPQPPPGGNKRVRSERRYGEEITSESFLQELKDEKAAKTTQSKQTRRAPTKRKVKLYNIVVNLFILSYLYF